MLIIFTWSISHCSLRDGLTVETLKVDLPSNSLSQPIHLQLKVFLQIWTGSKPGGPKPALCNALLDAKASIDWPRIHRWKTYSTVDPGEDPEEDVEAREWLMDRAMHMQILAGKVTVAKHLKVRCNTAPIIH